MKAYTVMVEGLVKRYISVQADTQAEAKELATEEFCALLGAERYLIDQSETVDDDGEILNWKENV